MVINQRVITNICLGGTVRKKSTEMPYAKQIAVDRDKGQVVADLRDKQGLRRLAMDPKNANALMALYESHEFEIRAAAIRWLGNNRDIYEQAIHNILVAIGRNARAYDPESTDSTEWVRQCADAEARRLRPAVYAAGSRGRRTRRAV
jgi:hypothetical protein